MTVTDASLRAATWLQAWDSQGTHRSGTTGDDAGAAWLAGEAAALGASVAIEEFALDRIEPVTAYLEFEGERVEGVPVFDAPATDADGVDGRLGLAGGDADILVTELSPQAVYSGEYLTLRRDNTQRGMVIICAGARPGLALLNAEQFLAPCGAPAIQVASEVCDTVRAAAGRGASARLVSHSRRIPSRGRNVVIALHGPDHNRPPLVVMTPRSSWWQSTAERGGGLVCWLETLRALLAAPPGGDVILTANSGHELGHLGLDDFVARRPGWDQPADRGGATWIHYGANLGAERGSLSIQSTSDNLRTLANALLTRAGRPPDAIAPKDLVPSGETRDIHRAGGNYLTFVGSNSRFHLPQDRWPDAVDVPAVTRIAAATAELVVRLTR